MSVYLKAQSLEGGGIPRGVSTGISRQYTMGNIPFYILIDIK
jgi:hypothetical protein